MIKVYITSFLPGTTLIAMISLSACKVGIDVGISRGPALVDELDPARRINVEEQSYQQKPQLRALHLAGIADLPSCDATNEALLVYLADEKRFLSCQLGTWQTVNIANAATWQDDNAVNSVLIMTEPVSVGSECPAGGLKVLIGRDGNADGSIPSDGSLTGSEIESTQLICNGRDGSPGPAGAPGYGFESLVAFADEPPGNNCVNGGQKMLTGLDDGRGGGTARNGLLEASEILQTSYVCSAISNALELAWLQGPNSRTRNVTATWVPAAASQSQFSRQDLAVFSDPTCLTQVASPLPLLSYGTSSADVTLPADGVYYFRVKTFLTSGITYSSGCVREGIRIDTTAPSAAQALSWTSGATSASNSVEASWTPSTATDLASQALRLFSGANCESLLQTISGLSTSTSKRGLLTPGTGSFSYDVISFDVAGNQSQSSCSASVTVNSYETIQILGAPQGTTILSSFNVTITSSLAAFAAYAYALTNVISCPETGYSDWIAAGTPLPINTAAFADGPLRLCVISKDSLGNQRPTTKAVSTAWIKASSNPSEANFTPSDGVVHLTWSKFSTATIGYIVVRRVGSALTWAPVNGDVYTAGALDGDHKLVADITDGTMADDLGLLNGDVHYYTIYAYDSARSYTLIGSGSATPVAGVNFCGQLLPPSNAAACADPSNKTASGNFAGGDGTSGNPYVICTASQLNNIRNSTYASKFLIIGANIDLGSWGNWTPLPNFTGNLNGQGFHISGLSIANIASNNQGLFVSAGAASSLNNIIIRSGTVAGGTYSNIGSLLGSATNATISGVINCASVSGLSKIGGIVGSISNSQILNSTNSARVSASTSWAGGIAGSFSSTLATNANNLGNVSTPAFAGGIVGSAANGMTTALISASRNQGEILADTYAGGIAGMASGSGSVSRSQNFGQVGHITASFVGGITGKVDSATISGCCSAGPPDVSRSENYGVIRGFDNVGGISGSVNGFGGHTAVFPALNTNYGLISGNNNVGGIAGYMSGGQGVPLKDNSNYGSVTGNQSVGGVFGYVNSSCLYCTTHMTNNNNYGNIAGSSYVGGVVGAMIMARFNSASNTGNVTGSGDYVGGVLGKNFDTTAASPDTSSHLDLFNSGTITGAQFVGGIFGDIARYYSIGRATNAATGRVVGTNYVGGIVGGHATADNANGATTIANAVNYAPISGAMGVGGIFGYGTDVNLTTVSNYGSVAATGNYAGGIAGHAVQYDLSTTFTGLTNNAAVTGANWVGGIFGRSGTFGLSTCTNATSSPVTGVDYVGGIVGASGSHVTIANCSNASPVTGRAYVGGIVGHTPRDAILTNNTNQSAASVTGSSNYVGGIGGYLVYVATQRTHSGNVNWAAVSGVDYVGGIVGAADKSLFTSNTNRGAVAGRDYTAGIAGYGGANIDGAFGALTNYGAISGRNWVGGLIGFVSDLASSTGFYNYNNVTATGQYVGGAVGYYARNDNQNPTFSTVQNTGNIDGSLSIGGLFGSMYYGTITNGYNIGAVGNTSASYAGGLGGSLDSVTITSAVNTGAVSGFSYVGGLAGELKNSAALSTNPFWQHIANRGSVEGESDVGGFFGTAPLAAAIVIKWGINLEDDVVQACSARCGAIGGSTSGAALTTTSVYSVATTQTTSIGTDTSMLLTGFNNGANFLASPPSGGTAFPTANWNYNLSFAGQSFIAWPIGMP